MPTTATAPGVYRRASQARPAPGLVTGAPGFVGFVAAGAGTVARLERAEDIPGAVTFPAGEAYLERALRGFFANGGGLCHVSGAAAGASDREAALALALDALAMVEDLDLVAAPDAMTLRAKDGTLDLPAIQRTQQRLLRHCADHPGRFALLDSLPGVGPAGVTAQRDAVGLGQSEPVNGALYYPWIKTDGGLPAPPCGHVAGLVARTDRTAGPGRAPAGAALEGVGDVEFGLDAGAQGALNSAGINGLRAFAGRGVRVWGARTLSRDPAWTAINVRRLVLTLHRWIDANMGWTAFEPNMASTWARIERRLTAHLTDLWRAGALAGASVDQAFFVACDATTTSAADRDNGVLRIEIGLAPARPAEFIIVRLNLTTQAGG